MEHRSILLVEDSETDELLILRALRRVNLADRVEVVRDGQQALDYLFREGEFAQRTGAPPAAVVLDIGLPKVSGLKVLARLRTDERTALLPVVMLTSSDEDKDRLQSYEQGANSYVRKPIHPAEFFDTLVRLSLYWAGTNEAPI